MSGRWRGECRIGEGRDNEQRECRQHFWRLSLPPQMLRPRSKRMGTGFYSRRATGSREWEKSCPTDTILSVSGKTRTTAAGTVRQRWAPPVGREFRASDNDPWRQAVRSGNLCHHGQYVIDLCCEASHECASGSIEAITYMVLGNISLALKYFSNIAKACSTVVTPSFFNKKLISS